MEDHLEGCRGLESQCSIAVDYQGDIWETIVQRIVAEGERRAETTERHESAAKEVETTLAVCIIGCC